PARIDNVRSGPHKILLHAPWKGFLADSWPNRPQDDACFRRSDSWFRTRENRQPPCVLFFQHGALPRHHGFEAQWKVKRGRAADVDAIETFRQHPGDAYRYA